MFYLWPCLIEMTSPQEMSKTNNLKDMKSLMLPELPSKGRKKRSAKVGGEHQSHMLNVSGCDLQVLDPSFQETRVDTVPRKRWELFSLATSAPLYTLKRV